MSDKIIVNTEVLQVLSDSIRSISRNLTNISDGINSVRKKGNNAWKHGGNVNAVFEQNCDTIRKNCLKVKDDLYKHSQSLQEIYKIYSAGENKSNSIVNSLDTTGVFN